MGKYIYSDIRGEILKDELGDVRLYLYNQGGISKPSLVLPNLLAIKKLRDYCQEIIKKYPKYFEKVGEPINKEVKGNSSQP